MPLFKKKLTEQEVATSFMLTVIKEANERWPNIYRVLRENVHDESFILADEEMAKLDLALAGIAQGLQAVKNLFPKDQAERIEKWVLKNIDTGDDFGKYAVDEVKQYTERFQMSLQHVRISGDPAAAVPGRLVQRWLGHNIEKYLVEHNGEKTDIISPTLLMEIGVIMASFPKTWSWKEIKNNFKLTEDDLPLDEG